MCHTQVNISKLRGVFALSGNLLLKKEAKKSPNTNAGTSNFFN
jgi:hypothetical protein